LQWKGKEGREEATRNVKQNTKVTGDITGAAHCQLTNNLYRLDARRAIAKKRGISKNANQRKLEVVESSVGAPSKVSIKCCSCCSNLATKRTSCWFKAIS
jgi:hypothetical protein